MRFLFLFLFMAATAMGQPYRRTDFTTNWLSWINLDEGDQSMQITGSLSVSGGFNLPGLEASRVLSLNASGIATDSFASSVLAAALSDETGTGSGVLSNAPTINNPTFLNTVTMSGSGVNSSIDWIGMLLLNTNQGAFNITNGFFGLNTVTPGTRLHVVGNATIQHNALEAAGTNGLRMTNATAAASGVQQASPGIEWSGQGWKTTATAASQPTRFLAKLLPVQGSTAPSAVLNFLPSINDAAYSDAAPALSINTSGGIGVGVSAATVNAGFIAVGGGGAILSSSSGAFIQWPTTGSIDIFTANSGTDRHIRLSPNTVGSVIVSNKFALPSLSIQTLVAGAGITNNAGKVRVVGSGGAVTLTSTPSVQTNNILDGNILYIMGTDDTSTITIQDNGTLAGSLIELGGAATTRIIGKGDILTLLWDRTEAKWFEQNYNDN